MLVQVIILNIKFHKHIVYQVRLVSSLTSQCMHTHYPYSSSGSNVDGINVHLLL